MPTGRCRPQDVASLFDAGFRLPATASLRTPSAHGPTEEIPYLKHQQRLTFARVGHHRPASLDDYLAHGGYRGLKAALAHGARARSSTRVTASGLRGRGGAAFPAGIKWKTVLGAPGRRSTSSAMPMKATRAPSPIAC